MEFIQVGLYLRHAQVTADSPHCLYTRSKFVFLAERNGITRRRASQSDSFA